jgi:F-type H+-transporting ATPase subunit a
MIKKRYILLIVFIGLILFGCVFTYTQPELPVIQLPGECYPGTRGLPLFDCVTNTGVTTVLAWLIVAILGLSLRARSRTSDEVPTGYYNFFEMIIDGGLNFATGLAGRKKAKEFFALFVTLILFILVANWIELVPGVDSIGFNEHLPHLAEVVLEEEAEAAGEHVTEEELHQVYLDTDEENAGGFLDGPFLIKAEGNVDNCLFSTDDPRKGCEPGNADWAIVAFFRAPATDLNFTVALALVTMVMVQVVGFRHLGVGYLKKFFPWNVTPTVISSNPIKGIDWAVGILELVGEISRVISFSFRLLGNIFAGQILLFVIAFLVPAISVVFFGLEFFVGLIQAVVFGLLALMFMSGASEHHGDDDHH